MECARTRFLRQSNSLELCPDWPEKRPSKSIYKTNEILTFWLQWPSDVAIRVSRACFFFLLKWCKSTSENLFSEGEAYFWRWRNAFGATLTDVWWVLHIVFFRGISMELMISLGDLCEKWIRGNVQKICLCWVCFRGAKTAFTKHRWAPFQMRKKRNVFLTLTKFGLMRLLKITVFQIGDLQNMLYFPGASHISPMETFTLAD